MNPAYREYLDRLRRQLPAAGHGRRAVRLPPARDRVLAHYGPCACCREPRREFLVVLPGHPSPGPYGGRDLVRLAVQRGFPVGMVRVLCRNCWWAERNGGCPHQRRTGRDQ